MPSAESEEVETLSLAKVAIVSSTVRLVRGRRERGRGCQRACGEGGEREKAEWKGEGGKGETDLCEQLAQDGLHLGRVRDLVVHGADARADVERVAQ